jgi:acetyl esterase/lipase
MLAMRLIAVAAFTIAASAAGVTTAGANVPSAVTKANTLHIPAMGGATDGTLTTTVTYSDTAATASASTGNTIWLGKGNLFKLTSCVAYHAYGSAPVSSCADRVVDTRANTATIYTYAPSVALYNQPRPSGSVRFGYFTASVQVAYASGSTWVLASYSWPDNGLQGAGIPVAAQNAAAASLPASGSFTITGAYSGAIDSGQPDSICRGMYAPTDGSPRPADVSTSNAAFAGAPAYYEIGQPTGAYAGRARRGTMLVIHGGSWVFNGQGGVEAMRPVADRWRARGFQTVNITYRPCGQSAKDVAWFYDHTRSAVGPAEKLCAAGASAGANLALLLATWRSDVYCVVSEAGPTDLTTVQTQGAYDPATNALTQVNGGRWVHNLAAAAFGDENLAAYSPAVNASGALKATRVLQGFSADDALVPWGQATELRAAMLAANASAYVDTVQLPKGTVKFGHGAVTQASLDDFYAREVNLVSPIAG